jgi:hypothetical protein
VVILAGFSSLPYFRRRHYFLFPDDPLGTATFRYRLVLLHHQGLELASINCENTEEVARGEI